MKTILVKETEGERIHMRGEVGRDWSRRGRGKCSQDISYDREALGNLHTYAGRRLQFVPRHQKEEILTL